MDSIWDSLPDMSASSEEEVHQQLVIAAQTFADRSCLIDDGHDELPVDDDVIIPAFKNATSKSKVPPSRPPIPPRPKGHHFEATPGDPPCAPRDEPCNFFASDSESDGNVDFVAGIFTSEDRARAKKDLPISKERPRRITFRHVEDKSGRCERGHRVKSFDYTLEGLHNLKDALEEIATNIEQHRENPNPRRPFRPVIYKLEGLYPDENPKRPWLDVCDT